MGSGLSPYDIFLAKPAAILILRMRGTAIGYDPINLKEGISEQIQSLIRLFYEVVAGVAGSF